MVWPLGQEGVSLLDLLLLWDCFFPVHQVGTVDLMPKFRSTQALTQQALGRSVLTPCITGYQLTASAFTPGRAGVTHKPLTCSTSPLENSSTARTHLQPSSNLTSAHLDSQQVFPLPEEATSCKPSALPCA